MPERPTLRSDVVRDNARAWGAHTALPIWAVVKNEGYGWGVDALIAACEPAVEGYCVADRAEFLDVRARTRKPIIVLGPLDAREAVAVARDGGHPNVTSLAALRAIAEAGRERPLRARLGIAPARGWFGIDPREIDAYAHLAAASACELELWAHPLEAAADAATLADFAALRARFSAAGARVVAHDVLNTRAATTLRAGTRARIGAGLFGAYGANVPGVRNAVRLDARCVAADLADATTIAGVRRAPIPAGDAVLTLRVGYGDGLPRGLAGARLGAYTVASVGMQYAVLHAPASSVAADENVALFGAEDDLAALAATGGAAAHEIICGLGNSARRRSRTP